MRCLTLVQRNHLKAKAKTNINFKTSANCNDNAANRANNKNRIHGLFRNLEMVEGGSCVASPSANEHRFGLSQAAVSCASRNRNRNLNWLIKTSKKRVARQLNKRPDDVRLPPSRPRSDSSRLTNTSAPAGYGSCPWRPVALHLIWGH